MPNRLDSWLGLTHSLAIFAGWARRSGISRQMSNRNVRNHPNRRKLSDGLWPNFLPPKISESNNFVLPRVSWPQNISGSLPVKWVPCFTALRGRVFTECWHAYVLDVFLEKSSEHDFLWAF